LHNHYYVYQVYFINKKTQPDIKDMTIKHVKTIKHTFFVCLLSFSYLTVAAQQTDTLQTDKENPDPASTPPAFSRGIKNNKANKAEVNWRMRVYNSNQAGTSSETEIPKRRPLNNSDKIKVPKPYMPLQLTGNEISLLGRKVILNANGFPDKIQSFFTPDMRGMASTPTNIITEAVHFHIINAATHKDIKFRNLGITYKQTGPGIIKWSAVNTSDGLKMDIGASIFFDGFLSYTVKITAIQDVKLDDIKLHLPYSMQTAEYLVGLSNKGVNRPDTLKWKWDMDTKQDGAWIGIRNAGLQYSLLDDKYVRPLQNKSHLEEPRYLPSSWDNNGKGGMLITEKGTSMLSESYSGTREMKKGETLYYNFTLLITPMTMDQQLQWLDRFYRDGKL